MISSLEIKNYRGFEHYKIDSLAPVNLFVGKNNTGKTSILEALQFYFSKSPLSSIMEITRKREEALQGWFDTSGTALGDFADIRHVFFGHRIGSDNNIVIIGGGHNNLIFRITEEKTTELRPEALSFTIDRDAGIIEKGFLSKDGAVLNEQSYRRLVVNPSSDGSLFVSPDGFNTRELMGLCNFVIENAFEDSLVSSLNIINKDISNVFFLPNGQGGTGRILIGNQSGQRDPLGSYGDGMRRLLGLAMAFVNVQNGQLLVDEVDSGLHYSVMPDLWNLIIGTSERLAVQTYLTTHSLDCVRGLRDALNLAPNMADQVAVHKLDRRLDYAISFTGSQLINALNGDVELR